MSQIYDVLMKSGSAMFMTQDQLADYVINHKNNIYHLFKSTKIHDKVRDICLYTCEVRIKGETLIDNYRRLSKMYGNNPLSDFDCEIIQLLHGQFFTSS